MNRQNHLTLDIETGPGSLAEIEPLLPPVSAPANYKDPEKIAAYIEAEKEKLIERAALEATTGVVLCATVAFGDDEPTCYGDDNEPGLIQETLTLIESAAAGSPGIVFVTFNGHRFDFLFLIRRAFRYGIRVPQILRQRFYKPTFVDLMEEWQCGNREQTISLDRMCKFCNVPGKVEGVEGKDFHRVWKTNRPKAKSYACGDVIATRALAKHIGAI